MKFHKTENINRKVCLMAYKRNFPSDFGSETSKSSNRQIADQVVYFKNKAHIAQYLFP